MEEHEPSKRRGNWTGKDAGAGPASASPRSKRKALLPWFKDLVREGGAMGFLRPAFSSLFIALVVVALNVALLGQTASADTPKAKVGAEPTATIALNLPGYDPAGVALTGVERAADMHTTLPTRPRFEVSQYTVQQGDTVITIAQKYNLQSQSILFSNYAVLRDDPHLIIPGQVLNIPPEDGAIHVWTEGEGLNAVAKQYGVSVDTILQWPGNHLDPTTLGDLSHPNIAAGTKLFVPGGKRPFTSWSAPQIPRTNPAVAHLYGEGACSASYNGPVGSGSFIWPTTEKYVSGYDYNPGANHPAIDIGAHMGNPIFAADSGVVVYAGWNNFGYGIVVVIDHGNGWQTLYAHMSALNVGCGSWVDKGATIGFVGVTGNSSGPHLHFEMMYKGAKVNPHDYVSP